MIAIASVLPRCSARVIALGCAGLLLSASAASAFDITNPLASFFGGDKYETKILPDVPATQIYDQGLARLQTRDYDGAGKRFDDLQKNFPQSTEWGQKSLLMQTYSQYQAAKYDDAVGTANRYIGLYPNSSDTPYVYYLAGMSYYNQIPEVTRDQTTSEKAVSILSALVQKYPKSEYVADAKYKIQVAKDQLAGREMTVGRWYLEKSNYTAAANRFREVLAKYQSTRHTEEALYRLVEAYLRLGITNEAQTAAAVLGHNFPGSQWYQDAYNLLKTGGLEPSEDRGSWISRTVRRIGIG